MIRIFFGKRDSLFLQRVENTPVFYSFPVYFAQKPAYFKSFIIGKKNKRESFLIFVGIRFNTC